MTGMIIDLVPFEPFQRVYVYNTETNEVLDMAYVKTEEILNYPCVTFTKFNFNKVVLHGQENYCKKIKQDIIKTRNENFNSAIFEVEIKGD